MRRGAIIAAITVLTIAAVLGVLAFFNARDDSTIGEERTAPGKPDPALTSDQLRRGNVVLLYSRPADRAPLEKLADDLAGPVDPTLTEAGQSILIERRPRGEKIIANAYKRSLVVDSAEDPRLRDFATYWLGRGAVR